MNDNSNLGYPAYLDEDPEYVKAMEAELAQHERECGNPWVGGPAHDPYGSHCDLPKGHDGDHSGPNPFGDDAGLFTWTRERGRREALRRFE